MTNDAFEQDDAFEALSKALAPFGWKVTEQFASEYHQNVYVYNLANALVAATAENNRLKALVGALPGKAEET